MRSTRVQRVNTVPEGGTFGVFDVSAIARRSPFSARPLVRPRPPPSDLLPTIKAARRPHSPRRE